MGPSLDSLELRPATDADFEWILDLRREAYAPYVDRHFGGWDEAREREHLRVQWPRRTRSIVLLDGREVGYVGYGQRGEQLWLGNIILRPEARGLGIGTRVLTDWLEWVDLARAPAGLSVFEDNPAVSLYERLGFRFGWSGASRRTW